MSYSEKQLSGFLRKFFYFAYKEKATIITER